MTDDDEEDDDDLCDCKCTGSRGRTGAYGIGSGTNPYGNAMCHCRSQIRQSVHAFVNEGSLYEALLDDNGLSSHHSASLADLLTS